METTSAFARRDAIETSRGEEEENKGTPLPPDALCYFCVSAGTTTQHGTQIMQTERSYRSVTVADGTQQKHNVLVFFSPISKREPLVFLETPLVFSHTQQKK
jgi:hypothetical protein